MKTNYTIKNFRVFDNKGVTIELAPLTFLVGCNSSGKSSIVKSLSLLKTFFMNKFDMEHPVIGSPIDFTIKPNDSLGSFNNVVKRSSRNKDFSLSYEVHSSYINDDVVVCIVIGKGDLGNATITKISISKTDGTLLLESTSNTHSRLGNLLPIKDAFKQYLIATMFRTDVKALLPSYPELELDTASKMKIKELEKAALIYCSSQYLSEVYQNRTIQAPHTNIYVKQAIKKFVETGIITYYSIFDEMGEMSSRDEVSAFLKSKVKEGEIHDAMMKVIDCVSEDFAKSGFPNFPSYYRSLEEAALFATYNLSLGVIKGGLDFSLYTTLLMNRQNYIYTLSTSENTVGKIDYDIVHDMLSLLVEKEEPYSSVFKDEFDESFDRRLHPLYTDTFSGFVENFCLEVVSKDVTEGLDYISSSRIQVRRLYPMDDSNEFSGAVRRYFETKTKFMTLSPPIMVNVEDEDGSGHHAVKVSDFVPGSFMNKWLRIFKIGDHLSLEMDKNGLGLLLKVYRSASDKKGVLLADMGYGITQLFSILLQIEEMIMSAFYEKFKLIAKRTEAMETILSSYKNTPFDPRTVAIEEPEIHLHPKYQSLLADMIYDAYSEYNIQFIIETHSEYLLRKIQTLVGAKKLSPEEVSITYVEDDELVKNDARKVRRIPIMKDGRLTEPFGPGFYDEAGELSKALLKMKIEAKKD